MQLNSSFSLQTLQLTKDNGVFDGSGFKIHKQAQDALEKTCSAGDPNPGLEDHTNLETADDVAGQYINSKELDLRGHCVERHLGTFTGNVTRFKKRVYQTFSNL